MKFKQLPKRKHWERELIRAWGEDATRIFMARAQARYAELLDQARRYDNKALRQHFEDNILPALAAYSILLMDGMEKESAGRVIDSLLEAGVETTRRMYRFWGRFPFFFDMLRLTLKPMMTSQFPERWNVEWLELGPDLVGLNCRACFYLEMLTEYGFPELTPHFCRLDDLLAAEAAPSIRFERTQTLARGGTLCDFRYARVKAGK